MIYNSISCKAFSCLGAVALELFIFIRANPVLLGPFYELTRMDLKM